MDSTLHKAFYILAWIIYNVHADKIVQTNTGLMKGITVSKGDLSIEAFLGVPYAEPPVNELRFRNPLPKTPWSGIYNAFTLPPSCMQNNSGHYFEPSLDTPMSEDCLFLNLWMPYSSGIANESKPLKPIMIFIHGGGFNSGSSNMKLFDGTNLSRKGDVIVATLNYRVGVFGFLFANVEEDDDNMGMMDQIMAMKWIRDNAGSFGGDPHHIVLFGESAGSMSVGAHLSSPMSRNLFKRAIMQSGSPTTPISTLNNTGILKMTHRLAYYLGCDEENTDDPRGMVACFRNMSAKALADAEGHVKISMPLTFYPRIGGEFSRESPILTLRKGIFQDTELLMGFNEMEGPFFLAISAPQYFGEHGSNQMRISSKRFARNLLRAILQTAGVSKEKGITNRYVNPIENGTSSVYLDTIGNAIGDYLVTCGVYFHAELHSLRNPVYYYKMKRRPSTTPLADWMKTTHFDELQYVFGNPLFENFTPEEEAFSNKLMERWLAFAKTGNPNIPGEADWPVFHLKDQKYLEMNDVDIVRTGRPEEGRCEIWRETYLAFLDEDVVRTVTNRKQDI